MPKESDAYMSSYNCSNVTYDFYHRLCGGAYSYPDEGDYNQTILHEYCYIYQHTKIPEECTTNSHHNCELDKKLTGN